MIAIFHIVRIITHQITSQWGLHAQWSMKVARQKRSEICAVRVAKSKKNDLFWEHFFPDQKATKHWKGCHFFQHVDAPTRAIPHPAGCFCVCVYNGYVSTLQSMTISYTHTYTTVSRSRGIFSAQYMCTRQPWHCMYIFMCIHTIYIYLYTLYIYNQIYIYIMFVLIRQMPGLSPEPHPRQATHHHHRHLLLHHHHQTLFEDLQWM